MKYKTKHDIKLQKSFQEKQLHDDELRYASDYADAMWSTSNFSLWDNSSRRGNTPIRNLYKEIIKLNRLCM